MEHNRVQDAVEDGGAGPGLEEEHREPGGLGEGGGPLGGCRLAARGQPLDRPREQPASAPVRPCGGDHAVGGRDRRRDPRAAIREAGAVAEPLQEHEDGSGTDRVGKDSGRDDVASCTPCPFLSLAHPALH